MKYIPFESFLGKPLTLHTGEHYSKKEVLEAANKFSAQFKRRAYCIDCNKDYEQFPLDIVLSNEQWEMIHHEKDGLLCANCIASRASKLDGVIRIDVKIIFAK